MEKKFSEIYHVTRGERSVGRGVGFGVATMKTGIQYWYDT